MNKKNRFIRNTHVIYWVSMADELHHSTKVLETDISHHRVHYQDAGIDIDYPVISGSYIVLAAYSMENLFKAMLLVEQPELQDDEGINKKLYTHDLAILANECSNIQVDEIEAGVLGIMSKSSTFWSRYPVPRHFSKMEERSYLDNNFIATYKKMFERIRDRLSEMTEQGYTGMQGGSRPGMKIEEKNDYFDKDVNDKLE